MGEEVCHLYELCRTGDIAAATLLQQKLIGPNAAVRYLFLLFIVVTVFFTEQGQSRAGSDPGLQKKKEVWALEGH